jgi:hypothetical protein
MPVMKWRIAIIALTLATLAGCTVGTQSWSRSGRSNCFGQTRQADGESGLVFFCAESP